MSEVQLGRLRFLTLREVWPHEERDFTPWLADDANLASLSSELGLDLQLERIEVAVGPYSADILAKDASGALAVIENQFSRTNHDHLGKVITYAATLGASIIIWIAERFTDEHQKAVEWLNENTGEEISIFAVQPEIFCIDNSAPAVRFNVVSRPNEAVRAAAAARTTADLTEAQQLQLEFWTQFRQRLLAQNVLSSARSPRPAYWYDIPLGLTGIHISNIVDTMRGRVGVRIYIKGALAETALRLLGPQREAIEQEIGVALEWNPRPENQDKIIGCFRSVDLANRTQWPEYVDWLVDMTSRFRAVFGPRVQALRLALPTPAPTAE